MKPSTLPFKMVILVQVTSGISGDVCLQTLTDIQSWVGDPGLIMVHEKYFFTNHISREVNYDAHSSWRISNPT
jgi:hypothetical protein